MIMKYSIKNQNITKDINPLAWKLEWQHSPPTSIPGLSYEDEAILVPRALLTRGQPSATRGSGQIHIKMASDWLQRRLLF
jgi:hypothetical protein